MPVVLTSQGAQSYLRSSTNRDAQVALLIFTLLLRHHCCYTPENHLEYLGQHSKARAYTTEFLTVLRVNTPQGIQLSAPLRPAAAVARTQRLRMPVAFECGF